jgi:hypothetical protein
MLIKWEELLNVKPRVLLKTEQGTGEIRVPPTRSDSTEQAYFDFAKSSLKQMAQIGF